MKRSVLIAAVAAALAVPALASAQGGPGFLFKRPSIAIGVRAGWMIPRTNGDLFGQTLDDFIPLGETPSSSLGFDSPYLGGEFAIRPWQRWDLALGVGWSRSRSMSEYRDWSEGSAPIAQETTFQVVSGTLGAKYYFQDRGRRVSSLAWVPRRLTPFVGGGVGIAAYEFTQVGDFVDEGDCEIVGGEESCAIFSDYLESSGEGLLLYGSAGIDLTVTKNALVTFEARYSLSDAGVSGSYLGFNDIDLAGLQLMIGLGFQF